MRVAYDENVITSFADDLYRRAASLIVGHTVLGGLAGAAVGLAGCLALRTELAGLGAVLLTLLGALVGLSLGRARAFALRLTAQTALCQVRIERNTRLSRTDIPPPFAVGNAGAFPAQRYDR